MSNLTFEYNETNAKLETYEWDNTWIEQANDEKTPRVLYIGDSISCGIRTIATAQSKGTLLFDGFGTSKAIDNPYFKDSIHLFALQQNNRKYVVFNNGLHGWHLDDEKEYPDYYEKMIKFLLDEFKDSQLFIVLTTYSEVRTDRIIKRNKVAKELAEKYNLPIIDLYTVSKQFSSSKKSDDVHFTNSGYKILADTILEAINNTIIYKFTEEQKANDEDVSKVSNRLINKNRKAYNKLSK